MDHYGLTAGEDRTWDIEYATEFKAKYDKLPGNHQADIFSHLHEALKQKRLERYRIWNTSPFFLFFRKRSPILVVEVDSLRADVHHGPATYSVISQIKRRSFKDIKAGKSSCFLHVRDIDSP